MPILAQDWFSHPPKPCIEPGNGRMKSVKLLKSKDDDSKPNFRSAWMPRWQTLPAFQKCAGRMGG